MDIIIQVLTQTQENKCMVFLGIYILVFRSKIEFHPQFYRHREAFILTWLSVTIKYCVQFTISTFQKHKTELDVEGSLYWSNN